jgi:hypothetical protein
MDTPSVKGTLFMNAVAAVRDLIDHGEVSEHALSHSLKEDDRHYLDEVISISSWYPIASYARLLTLVADHRTPGSQEHHIAEGRRSAQRMVEMGIYRQLDSRTEGAWEDRIGRLLVTLSAAFFNFTRWEWRNFDSIGFELAVYEAQSMPEVVALRTQGFIEFLASRSAKAAVRVTMQRSSDGAQLLYTARLTS